MDPTRLAIHLKEDPVWHILPNTTWRNAWFYGKSGTAWMPCGVRGDYGGRLSMRDLPGYWSQYPDRDYTWCPECLHMELTGDWPPDPQITWP